MRGTLRAVFGHRKIAVIELWIPITLGGAFLQNLRSALQKDLTARLSTGGATYARFLFAAPLAVAYALLVGQFGNLPQPNATFLAWAALGGLAQIVATFLLIASFTHRNFAVGTAYSKTEIVQVAVLGLVVIGDPLTVGALLGILISLAGVLLLTLQAGNPRSVWRALLSPAALPGLLAGTVFAVSVVSYRSASLALPGGSYLERAALTLAFVTVWQALTMGLWLRWREPGQFTLVIGALPAALWVGLVGMLASVCWFTAMTIESAAYVRALGQVELVFAFAAGVLLFGERSTRRELAGVALIVAGVLVLLLV